MTGTVHIVQGGQYGSEAKGAIAAHVAARHPEVRAVVRTGGANAGHTVWTDGQLCKMQQLPTAWATRPDVALVIGAGASLSPDTLWRDVQLARERGWCRDAPLHTMLKIDHRAKPHLPRHTDAAQGAGSGVRIGATGEGCSRAWVDFVADRRNSTQAVIADFLPSELAECLTDTELFLNRTLDHGGSVVLEGTQGTLLDISLGRYPYVTHKQTGPAQWLMEAGLSPSLPTRVWLVLRSMPIRVAGTSGVLPNELALSDWLLQRQEAYHRLYGEWDPRLPSRGTLERFGRCLAAHRVAAQCDNGLIGPEHSRAARVYVASAVDDTIDQVSRGEGALLLSAIERTTVTKLPRRIGNLDPVDTKTALRQTRPDVVVCTMMDYLFPLHADEGASCVGRALDSDRYDQMWSECSGWVHELQRLVVRHGGQVGLLTWGPRPQDRLPWPHVRHEAQLSLDMAFV